MSSLVQKINFWAAPYVWKKKPADNLTVHWEETGKPFFDDVPQVSEERVQSALIQDNKKWEHKEYIKEINGRFKIDPKSGFVIDQDDAIIRESIIFDHYGAYPEKLRTAPRKTTHIPRLVLYDHFWSANYFHFYSDIFTKLHLIAQRMPALKELPLVVSRKIADTKMFRFFMQFPEAASFRWHIQEADELIRTENVFLLQPMPYGKAHWNWTRTLAQDYLKPLHPGKRIFINRPARTGRHIANFENIAPVLEEQGFEVAEMENKTVEEQIALFSEASSVVSIHGAAMANMIFCHPQCRILEVTAADCINSHYYWLAQSLGLASYDCLTGGAMEINRMLYPKGRFSLDAEKTRNYLQKLKSS